jgi:hypothetical protein
MLSFFVFFACLYGGKIGWKFVIYENLMDKSLVEKSKKMGYKDFKYLIYGSKNSGVLSLRLSMKKEGPVSHEYCIVAAVCYIDFGSFLYSNHS